MKKTIAIMTLFLSLCGANAQYGIEGAIYAALDIGITFQEMNHLKHISETQDGIVTYSAIIAAESLAIQAIDQKILESQTKIKPIIEELQMIIQVSQTAEQLISYQSQIMQLVQEVPELAGLASNSQYRILSDAGYILKDLYIYAIDGEKNLMSNKDRIDIIMASLAGLEELARRSKELYLFIHMARHAELQGADNPINITGTMQQIEKEIETIIK